MSDRVGTRQPSIPDPGRLCAEHLYLIGGVVFLTVAVVGLVVDYTTAINVQIGTVPILVGLFAVGVSGWIVGSAERRVRRELGGKVAELTTVLAELRDQVEQQRQAAAPPAGKSPCVPMGVGRRHRSSREGDRSEYWTVYSDVLDDLGGLDGAPPAS